MWSTLAGPGCLSPIWGSSPLDRSTRAGLLVNNDLFSGYVAPEEVPFIRTKKKAVSIPSSHLHIHPSPLHLPAFDGHSTGSRSHHGEFTCKRLPRGEAFHNIKPYVKYVDVSSFSEI